MFVKVDLVLSKDTRAAYEEARLRASTLLEDHRVAEHAAFMALMAEIGVGIGDKVTITQTRCYGDTNGTAILTGPKQFSLIKADGTASKREFHVYAPYTVEKFTPTPA